MLRCTMSDISAEESIRRPASARCLLWLLPFSIASALVASARHSHDWAAFLIQAALGFVIVATGYATIALHRIQFEKRNKRIAQLFFVATVTICAFVIVSRLLFPIPSTPSNDETRINRILDAILCWPLVALSFGGIFIAVYSANWKLSLYLLFSVVLMLMIAVSMHGTSRHWLRTLNSFIT